RRDPGQSHGYLLVVEVGLYTQSPHADGGNWWRQESLVFKVVPFPIPGFWSNATRRPTSRVRAICPSHAEADPVELPAGLVLLAPLDTDVLRLQVVRPTLEDVPADFGLGRRVLTPLQHVAEHVEQAEIVGLQQADRVRLEAMGREAGVGQEPGILRQQPVGV